MRVAVVQYDPKLGRVRENIERVNELCAKLQPGTLDLLCLPEMALTGYKFLSADDIAPYLEDPLTGPTSTFCAALAARLRTYVAAGFPERLSPADLEVVQAEARGAQASGAAQSGVTPVGANSAALWDRDGQRVDGITYRKTNLFETDMTWAQAGTGFIAYRLPPPLGTLALGICMDLNVQPPAMWTPWGPYELAMHCMHEGADTLVLLNAWLASAAWGAADGAFAEGAEDNDGPDWQVLDYWAARLGPLFDGEEDGRETAVVVCNRTGEENGARFAGSSALFSLKRGSGKARVLETMTRDKEGVSVWTVPTPGTHVEDS